MTRESSGDQSDVSDDDLAEVLVGTEEKSDPAAKQIVTDLDGSTEFTHRDDDSQTFTT